MELWLYFWFIKYYIESKWLFRELAFNSRSLPGCQQGSWIEQIADMDSMAKSSELR
jgi:hypothetical protein